MMIFPGYLQASCRFFQGFFKQQMGLSFKLSAARELVAAFADLNSYSHLIKLINDKEPVRLSMTQRFTDLLDRKHKIQLSDSDAITIEALLQKTPLTLMPVPQVSFPAVSGFKNNLPHFGEFYNHTARLTSWIEYFNAMGSVDDLGPRRFDVDLLGYIEDPEEELGGYMEKIFIDLHPELELGLVGQPDPGNKKFDAWVEALLKWEHKNSDFRDAVIRECDLLTKTEQKMMRSADISLITSGHCVKIPDEPDDPLGQAFDITFGTRGLLYFWHATRWSSVDTYFDARARYDSGNQASERYIFSAIYSNGQFLPVGLVKGLSISGTNAANLDMTAHEHSDLASDMAQMALDFLETDQAKDLKDSWNDKNPLTVTSLLDVVLAEGKGDSVIDAFLASHLMEKTQPILLTQSVNPHNSSKELADIQMLPYVDNTSIELMLVTAPSPKLDFMKMESLSLIHI